MQYNQLLFYFFCGDKVMETFYDMQLHVRTY
jgi:hypothetical protein